MAHQPKKIIAPIVLILVVTVVVALVRARRSDGDAMVLSGTVEATESHLGFPVAGRVDSVLAEEGDLVKRGALLAVLEDNEPRARRSQAAAQVAVARAQLDEVLEGSRSEEIAAADANRKGALERWENARVDLARAVALHEGGAISDEAYEKARLAEDVARTQHEAAEEQFRMVFTGPRKERIAAQQALLHQAEAALEAAEATLANLRIVAPFDGVVSIRHREEGEIVPAGGAVLSVQDLSDRWVRVYVPERRLAAVRVGASASIANDTFPKKRYAGKVATIASEAEFTPKTVQTKEERVKLVFAVKVRITGDSDVDLKPGMPVDVDLRVSP